MNGETGKTISGHYGDGEEVEAKYGGKEDVIVDEERTRGRRKSTPRIQLFNLFAIHRTNVQIIIF